MGEYHLHSLILAADYRVADPESMWDSLKGRQQSLANIDAHHVVLYKSIWEPGRILVTIGISHPNSVREVLRSPAIFDLFDISGVDDIPAVFAGEVVEKIDLYEPDPDDADESVAGVIVGVVTTVDSVEDLMVKVHGAADRFRQSGVRKIWVYHAFDDGHEVLILQEIADELSARRWIDHPDAAAEWMSQAGFGAYPSLFVGKFAHLMTVGI
ncbi:fatty-acid--CoA ligase [Mycobacterium sp. BMJ-28]